MSPLLEEWLSNMPISRDRPRPGLSLLSPRLHTKALGTRLEVTFLSLIGQDKYPSSRSSQGHCNSGTVCLWITYNNFVITYCIHYMMDVF